MSTSQLPPELQSKVTEYQQAQNQLRQLRVQIEAVNRQSAEMRSTLKDLEKADSNLEIYKMTGNVMFRSTLEKVKADLQENVEFSDIKLQKWKKEEDRLSNRTEVLAHDLREALPQE